MMGVKERGAEETEWSHDPDADSNDHNDDHCDDDDADDNIGGDDEDGDDLYDVANDVVGKRGYGG